MEPPLMEWMAPAAGVAMRHSGDIGSPRAKEPSMEEISTIGLVVAKSVFQGSSVKRLIRRINRSEECV